ncbi:hypothetical protein NPX13_g10092 [Xylaria arbuscula]|uniref:Uncharacterized protein n=1 Tax=Xylaria arbuscula TaxID=114810 RepID=A0A9W8N570_9PEZI|nr:hypothetical protein NPX13_g10092 [Xylaria arbuscula]
MSGTFHLDTPQGAGGRGTPFSAVHPGIFRPPTSPSVSSSVYLGRSTGSLQSEAPTPFSTTKRKRVGPKESTPFRDWRTAADGMSNTDDIVGDHGYFDLNAGGPHRRYVLAGQIDTPHGGIHQELGSLEDSVYSDVDYRRALGPTHSYDSAVNSPALRPMDIDPQDSTSSGWGAFAISTIGGVVGKVWEFCRTGGFRGFYAGGGKGYDMSRGATGQQLAGGQLVADRSRAGFGVHGHEPNPLDGSHLQPDATPGYCEHGTPESTPPPPAKRRQISHGTPTDELRKNWVMIDEPANVNRQPSLASASRASPY